jgi:hypothetical protein
MVRHAGAEAAQVLQNMAVMQCVFDCSKRVCAFYVTVVT